MAGEDRMVPRLDASLPSAAPTAPTQVSRFGRLAPVLGLFVLAPSVGEFLLGNLRLHEWYLGLILAPLYGCGAILVREIGRGSGVGWPAMVLLAAAYALIEDAPVDQVLWSDSYAGQDLLLGPSFLPALGMSVELTQTVLAIHTIWSICVPIALVEAMVPARTTAPWLGRRGLLVTGVIYLVGAVLIFLGNYEEEQFLASPAQLIGIMVAMAALIGLAIAVRRLRLRTVPGRPLSPLVVGMAALIATSIYWGPLNLIAGEWYEWVGVAIWAIVAPIAIVAVSRWSRQAGWDARHRLALAAGATLTCVWVAFPMVPESGGSQRLDLIGNAVFSAVGIAVVLFAGWHLSRYHVAARAGRITLAG